ncbi:MAG: peptide chain release factor N(5)-glutamine methyltransferase [Candidatus Tantalella remota]|nr:peptide chain release factor N(5)-glutamine methyltransferase [Candidatus Tantalella remota]
MEYSETIPIQYEEGKAAFLGMDIKVDPRVLIPRPETELLVSVAAELCEKAGLSRPRILEVGTGSGVIPAGLVKLMADCRVTGADISLDALEVAKINIKSLGIEENVDLVVSDMFRAFDGGYIGAFDCIVSNPPYVSEKDYAEVDAWVKAEPEVALLSGKEGMDHLEIIAAESGRYLKSGGFTAVEIGYDQADKVKEAFIKNGFSDVKSFRDINGYERVITGYANG